MVERLPNPYAPDAKAPGGPKSAATVIRMWKGGSHLEAKALAASLKLSGKDVDAIRSACPGWND